MPMAASADATNILVRPLAATRNHGDQEACGDSLTPSALAGCGGIIVVTQGGGDKEVIAFAMAVWEVRPCLKQQRIADPQPPPADAIETRPGYRCAIPPVQRRHSGGEMNRHQRGRQSLGSRARQPPRSDVASRVPVAPHRVRDLNRLFGAADGYRAALPARIKRSPGLRRRFCSGAATTSSPRSNATGWRGWPSPSRAALRGLPASGLTTTSPSSVKAARSPNGSLLGRSRPTIRGTTKTLIANPQIHRWQRHERDEKRDLDVQVRPQRPGRRSSDSCLSQ